jgi:hypothetical protein
LNDFGASVSVEIGDAAKRSDLERVFYSIRESGLPLKAVFHCAGLLADGVLSQLAWEDFDTVFGPKVYGGFLLHEFTKDMDLDCFVLFSSIASIITPAAQGNHAAACAYLDALARYRRSIGLAAISINWGPWGKIGSAMGENAVKQIQAQGMHPLDPELGMAAFERIIEMNPVQIGAVSMNWNTFFGRFTEKTLPPFFDLLNPDLREERPERGRGAGSAVEAALVDVLASPPPHRRSGMLLDHVGRLIKTSLGIDAAQAVDVDRPLSELGLDSLLAIEIRNRLMASIEYPKPLPTTILFDYPTISELSMFLERELFPARTADIQAPETDEMLASIKDLSEEDAEELLLKELAKQDEEYIDE